MLSQVLSYMHSFETKYGYILTDGEMIAVQRESGDDYGTIYVSEPVGWADILLALWGLHMLARLEPTMPRVHRPRPPGYTRPSRDADYPGE